MLESLASAGDCRVARVDFSELDDLPGPVARYFRYALCEGQFMVRNARMEQEGEFRTGQAERDWKPFRATERFTVSPPGFVWDAKIQVAPLLSIRVLDSYLHRKGSMTGAVAGVIRIIDQHDKPELSAGALQRYLAEAVWFPTALLPSQGIRWTPVDDKAAMATLNDGDVSASLEFRFSEQGEVIGTHGLRYREMQGKYIPTPWSGYYRNYAAYGGMQIPRDCGVEWILPEGRFPYCRVRFASVHFDPSGDR